MNFADLPGQRTLSELNFLCFKQFSLKNLYFVKGKPFYTKTESFMCNKYNDGLKIQEFISIE